MSTWLLCAGLGACGGSSPAPTPKAAPPAAATRPAAAATTPAAPATGGPAGDGAPGASKPNAPVDLTMEARQIRGADDVDRFQVTVRAVPRRDVASVELSIEGQGSVTLGLAAGAPTEQSALVEVPHGGGKDVIGTAVVTVDGKKMGAATQVRVGAPSVEPPIGTIIRLPDGTEVREVRP